jgi:cholesterol transport system auxiliary component
MTSHASKPPGLPSTTSGCGRRALTAMLGASGLALLAACSGTLLPKLPVPPARFTLDGTGPAAARTAAPAAPASLPEGTPVLVVAMPRAAPGYDSRRMVYLRRPQELETFAFHEWVDAPAQMLAPLLVRALQDSAGFRAVLLAPSGAAGAWRLETDLIRLHQDFSHAPSQIRLTLRAVLLDTATRRVIAWREFDVIEPATGDDPTAGVQAARRATQGVMRALAAFCSSQEPGTATEPRSRPRPVPSPSLPDRR